MSTKAKTLKIPTKSLPEDWKQLGAEQFNVSTSMIEKIVYGIVVNPEIFKYMLELAEEEQKRLKAETKELETRIAALAK
jgi:hypothetical protein